MPRCCDARVQLIFDADPESHNVGWGAKNFSDCIALFWSTQFMSWLLISTTDGIWCFVSFQINVCLSANGGNIMETGRDRSPINTILRLRTELTEYFGSMNSISEITAELPNRFAVNQSTLYWSRNRTLSPVQFTVIYRARTWTKLNTQTVQKRASKTKRLSLIIWERFESSHFPVWRMNSYPDYILRLPVYSVWGWQRCGLWYHYKIVDHESSMKD